MCYVIGTVIQWQSVLPWSGVGTKVGLNRALKWLKPMRPKQFLVGFCLFRLACLFLYKTDAKIWYNSFAFKLIYCNKVQNVSNEFCLWNITCFIRTSFTCQSTYWMSMFEYHLMIFPEKSARKCISDFIWVFVSSNHQSSRMRSQVLCLFLPVNII